LREKLTGKQRSAEIKRDRAEFLSGACIQLRLPGAARWTPVSATVVKPGRGGKSSSCGAVIIGIRAGSAMA